jgi:hypothetical protein
MPNKALANMTIINITKPTVEQRSQIELALSGEYTMEEAESKLTTIAGSIPGVLMRMDTNATGGASEGMQGSWQHGAANPLHRSWNKSSLRKRLTSWNEGFQPALVEFIQPGKPGAGIE